jgi:hypothetical protein
LIASRPAVRERVRLPFQLSAVVFVAVAALSALPAAYDAWMVGSIALAQLGGPARGTDFLNLYSGAALLLRTPAETYSSEAQLAVQRGLTGWDSPLVPFYLPPHSAVLVSWLGWLPYGVAYVVWLVVLIACIGLAAYWIAPRWFGRWSPVVWGVLSLAFLPVVLGLGQGQTTAITLLSFAAVARTFTSTKPVAWHLALAAVGTSLKPQFLPFVVLALILSHQWRALAMLTGAVAVLSSIGAVLIGREGLAAFGAASSGKLAEVLTSDPGFLPGPTLLHAAQWFLGVSSWTHVIAFVLIGACSAAFVWVWRGGLARDDASLLQIALLPVMALLAAPYALVYELSVWLVAFWLLWRSTQQWPGTRAVLLWLSSGIWLAANLGVAAPLQGGADIAALLGVVLMAYVVWQFQAQKVRPRR